MMKSKKFLALSIFFIAIISRLIPHYPNFTPIDAIALFGGAYLFSRFLTFALLACSLYITDFILNNTIMRMWFENQEGIIWFSDYMIWNAVAFMIIIGIGYFIRNKINFKNVALAAIASPLIFFIISNFGTWLSSPMYAKNIGGLVLCFEAALPFLRNSLISSIGFTAIMFGSYEWLKSRYIQHALVNS